MKQKIFLGISLVFRIVCIALGCYLLYNLGILRDEYNVSVNLIYASEILLFLLLLFCVTNLVRLIVSFKK